MAKDQRVEATRAHFDAQAADYDFKRGFRLHYEEMQRVLILAIPHSPEARFTVLELGVGTGILTEQILSRFPHAIIDGYDLSGEMLAQARKRLSAFGERIRLQMRDFATSFPVTIYDLVCSSLALHHLPRRGREDFYRRLAGCLVPGGVVLIADRIRPPTQELSARYRAIRRQETLEAGLTEEAVAEERLRQREQSRRLEGVDHGPSTLDEMMDYLRRAGLVNVDCLWKHGLDAVVYAERGS